MSIVEAIVSAKTHFLEGRSSISQDILLSVRDNNDWSSPPQIAVEIALTISSSEEHLIQSIENLHSLLSRLHTLKAIDKLPSVCALANAGLHLGFELGRLEMMNVEPIRASIVAKETFDMVYSWLSQDSKCFAKLINRDKDSDTNVGSNFGAAKNRFHGGMMECDSLCQLWKLLQSCQHFTKKNKHTTTNTTATTSAFDIDNAVYHLSLAVNRLALLWITNLMFCKRFSEAKSILNLRRSILNKDEQTTTSTLTHDYQTTSSFEFLEIVLSLKENKCVFSPIYQRLMSFQQRTDIQNEVLAYSMLMAVTSGKKKYMQTVID